MLAIQVAILKKKQATAEPIPGAQEKCGLGNIRQNPVDVTLVDASIVINLCGLAMATLTSRLMIDIV